MSLDEFQKRVARELERQEIEARREVAKKGWTFLGPEACRRSSPYRRARSFEPLRDRNPTFAVGRGNREAYIAAAAEVREFRREYRCAMREWRAGQRDVVFPCGTYLMWRVHAVAVSPIGLAA